MKMFDELMKFLYYNRLEAFKGVRKFNERLLVWLKDK